MSSSSSSRCLRGRLLRGGLGDVGRVYLRGEDSNDWHNGFGGGLWFAWLDRANTISATFGRSEGRNAFYVRTGFAF